MSRSCQAIMSEDLEDPRWDAFVASVPGGHHVQTSLWGHLKSTRGWEALRLLISEHGEIIAGGQMLIRHFPLIGSIAYITKGPLLTKEDPLLFEQFIYELHRISTRFQIQFLVVQPPNDGHAMTHGLRQVGFQNSWIELAPTASILIDLGQELDQLLAQMNSSTRRNINKGERKGVVVREGTKEDLDLFYKLYISTSQRQRFVPYPKTYFSKMWDLFHPLGSIQILIAEFEGEAISTLLIIPYGTTVITKVMGWSGQHSECRPNQSLFWGAMQWAKTHGYRWFDLEGIELQTAETILNKQPLSRSKRDSPDRFKLGFGGQVVIYPQPYEFVYNHWFRKVYHPISPWLGNWSTAYKKLLDYVRRG